MRTLLEVFAGCVTCSATRLAHGMSLETIACLALVVLAAPQFLITSQIPLLQDLARSASSGLQCGSLLVVIILLVQASAPGRSTLEVSSWILCAVVLTQWLLAGLLMVARHNDEGCQWAAIVGFGIPCGVAVGTQLAHREGRTRRWWALTTAGLSLSAQHLLVHGFYKVDMPGHGELALLILLALALGLSPGCWAPRLSVLTAAALLGTEPPIGRARIETACYLWLNPLVAVLAMTIFDDAPGPDEDPQPPRASVGGV